jgi:Peptidase family M23
VIYLAIFQTLVPAALLAWLSLFPMRSRWTYVVQMLSVGLVLVAFALVGLWMLPPLWVPYLFGGLFVLIVASQRLGPFSKPGKQLESSINLGVLGAVALLAAYAGYLGIAGLKGRSPADQTVVNITMPLAQGSYLIAQGGSNKTVNEHYTTLNETVPRYAAWRGQSKGLDIISIDRFGLRASGLLPENPAEYFTFDTPVLAPCDGPVVEALDGIRDMPVPQMDREHMLGNHVIIQCDGFFVVLAHFKKGSVLVSKGQMVKAGDKLGGMGNSGNSAEPHLHIHAQRDLPAGSPISGEPLALSLDGKFYVRNDRIVVE